MTIKIFVITAVQLSLLNNTAISEQNSPTNSITKLADQLKFQLDRGDIQEYNHVLSIIENQEFECDADNYRDFSFQILSNACDSDSAILHAAALSTAKYLMNDTKYLSLQDKLIILECLQFDPVQSREILGDKWAEFRNNVTYLWLDFYAHLVSRLDHTWSPGAVNTLYVPLPDGLPLQSYILPAGYYPDLIEDAADRKKYIAAYTQKAEAINRNSEQLEIRQAITRFHSKFIKILEINYCLGL